MLYASPRLYEWSIRKLHGKTLDRRFRLIAEMAGAGSVLDVACGTGLLAQYLHPKATYRGIDLNERFLRFSQAKGLQVHRQDVLDVPHYPVADTYVLCDLLHHIMPHHRTLLEQVLALGKNMVVCEPFIPSKSRLRRFVVRAILDNDFINPPRMDQMWYTEPELMQFFEDVMSPSRIEKIGEDVIALHKVS